MESPQYVRMSLAAAMTLGFSPGIFYRGARLRCVNLLLTYESGCRANCSFCGLARVKKKTHGDKKFIRVAWKTFPFEDVIQKLENAPPHVERVCISMITHPGAKADTLELTRSIRNRTDLPVSLLIAPTLLEEADLRDMKEAGADRIGVAIDCATPDLFDRLRGREVQGPHRWDHYWDIYRKSIQVFGQDRSGVHLIVGLGETEAEMVAAMARARRLGGQTHLFSFFPEIGSALETLSPPPMGQYRRIQAARFLIDRNLADPDGFRFNDSGQILNFGIPQEKLEVLLSDGVAFETSGCPGASGQTACNRPFGNERPGPDIRNFPFTLAPEDLAKAMGELRDYTPPVSGSSSLAAAG